MTSRLWGISFHVCQAGRDGATDRMHAPGERMTGGDLKIFETKLQLHEGQVGIGLLPPDVQGLKQPERINSLISREDKGPPSEHMQQQATEH